jgi:hypothetical protein
MLGEGGARTLLSGRRLLTLRKIPKMAAHLTLLRERALAGSIAPFD